MATRSIDKKKKYLSLIITIYCIIEIAFCLPCFGWALYHILAAKWLDFGVITFPLVLVAASFGLLSVCHYKKNDDIKARYFGKLHCFMLLASHILLSANYITGAIHDHGVDSDLEDLGQDSFFTVIAMYFALTAALFGNFSWQFYHLFKPPAYDILLDDTNAITGSSRDEVVS